MVLRPTFYEKPALNRSEAREQLGLDPNLPTGIVLFGGHGSSAMLDIVARLNAGSARLQLILICGKNTRPQEANAFVTNVLERR
jgi:hypothetical protein